MLNKIGLRKGELTVIGGESGHGKTTLLKNIVADSLIKGKKVMLGTLNIPRSAFIKGISNYMCGGDIITVGMYEDLKEKYYEGKLYYFDQESFDIHDIEQFITELKYFKEKYAFDVIVIDSLFDIVGVEENGKQHKFIVDLHNLAMQNDINIYLSIESEDIDGLSFSSPRFKMKGSGALSDAPDNCLTIWKNEDKVEIFRGKYPDYVLISDKSRHDGEDWKIPLWLDRISGQFLLSENDKPISYIE